MKSFGTGRYQPSVFAFFPRLGRGHAGKDCPACGRTPKATHHDQAGNRKEWEESVGIHVKQSRSIRPLPAPLVRER